MVKKFINFIIIFFLSLNLFAASQKEIKKYKILINLCKQINDKSCELKYYSYLYDVADDNLKLEIKNQVLNITNKLTKRQKSKIKLKDFKKNWVYYQVIKYQENKNLEFSKPYSNKIKVIGLLIPLTGEYSYIGNQIFKGVLAGLNFFSNPIDIKIKIFNTSSNNDFDKFLTINNDIQLIIGPVLNKSCIKFLPILKNSKIPTILLTSNLDFAKTSDNIFVHFININDEMKQLCSILTEDQINNLAILYPENTLGIKYKNAFFSECSTQNIKAILGYSPDTVDFRHILYAVGKIRKIKEDIFKPTVNIDGFLIIDTVEKALLIIPQIYFYDFKNPKIYGIDLWNNKKLFKLDKKFQKNITFLDCIDYNTNNILKKIYHKNVDFYLILAYDTITIVKNISNNIVKELKIKKFNLISGLTYFDKFGISHKNMKIFRINYGGK